jgi:DNA-binding transcriptional MerR regulator
VRTHSVAPRWARADDDAVTGNLMPVARFARLCRLSVEQVERYDELGLLAPARIDPATGEHRYATEQIPRALAIAPLRRIGVPLEAVAAVLAADDAQAVEQVLIAERDRVQAEMIRSTEILDAVERLLVRGVPGPATTLSRQPARSLLLARAECAVEDVRRTTTACLREAMSAAARRGIAWSPPTWGLLPLDLEPQVSVAAGIEVTGERGNDVHVLPGGLAAVTTHVGPYDGLSLAYHALLAWVDERGHQPVSPVREAYLADPSASEPDQLVTRLIVAIRGT